MTLEQFFISKNIEHSWSNYEVMCLAIINGLITSVILETIILLWQMSFYSSLKKALGMSFKSMIDMVASMNITDLILTAVLCLLWVVPIILICGFYTPLPYNYCKLKIYNVSYHWGIFTNYSGCGAVW